MDLLTRVKPKTETRIFDRQRYTLTFCPDNVPDERWEWTFTYTREYTMRGYAPSIDRADKEAISKIKETNSRAARQQRGV